MGADEKAKFFMGQGKLDRRFLQALYPVFAGYSGKHPVKALLQVGGGHRFCPARQPLDAPGQVLNHLKSNVWVPENQLLKALAREAAGEGVFDAGGSKSIIELLVQDLLAEKIACLTDVEGKLVAILIGLAQLYPSGLDQEHLDARCSLHEEGLSPLELPSPGSGNEGLQFRRLQMLKR